MTSHQIKKLIRDFLTPWRLWQRWEMTLIAMLATSGTVAIAIPALSIPQVKFTFLSTASYSLETEQVLLANSDFEFDQQEMAISQTTISETSFPDGVYLYGQSSTPEQIGQEYIVFQVQQKQVVGAVYLPQSEFNCFQGELNSTQLSLTMIYPDELTTMAESEFDRYSEGKLSIAEEQLWQYIPQSADALVALGSPLLPNEEPSHGFHQVNLDTYYPITQVSDNDRRIVDVCQDVRDR